MVKRFVFVLLCLLAYAISAAAQPLPAPQCVTLKALDAKFGSLNKGDDDQRREFARIVAEQFTFSFPGEGWGSKSAGAGRPQTKDVIARRLPTGRGGQVDFEGWDLVNGTTREATCNGGHHDLTGQVFIAVDAVNHLGPVDDDNDPPPPPPPPPSDAATAALQREQLAALMQIIQQLQVQNAALAQGLNEIKAAIAAGVKIRF